MSDIFGNPVDNHPAHVSLNPKCVYCQWVRNRIQREAVDAFIRDELPGLLTGYDDFRIEDTRIEDTRPLFEGWQLTAAGARRIAAKIAELRTKAR